MSVTGEPAGGAHRTLGTKAFAAILGLLAYLLASVVYVSAERSRIHDSILSLETLGRHGQVLARAEAAVASARIELDGAAASAVDAAALLRPSLERLAALEAFDAAYASLSRALQHGGDDVRAAPSTASRTALRDALERSAVELELRAARLAEQRHTLSERYERQYDTITVTALLLSLIGLAWFGTLVTWFFASLTRDIRRLEAHARRIVHGVRGSPLVVDRDDELGRLMHAVNRMSTDLDARENQLALQAQRRSHHDKMTAVGALAAGVAHEVNNPLAVIAGLAERIVAAQADLPPTTLVETAREILAQSQRAAQVARQLAEVAASHPAEHDWVDLNSLVRRVVQMMAYDRRYRRVGVDLQLDPDLPALRTDADAVQHVLMQLLAVGCAGADGSPSMRVGLGTRRAAPAQLQVWLTWPAAAGAAPARWSHDLALARAILRPLRGDVDVHQSEMGSMPTTIRIQLQSHEEPG